MSDRAAYSEHPETPPDFSGRTAILGGTFNPVHIGHLRLALEVAEGLGLAGVELMPCAVPPHKSAEGLLPFDVREAFLRAAIEHVPGERAEGPELIVSLLEAELEPPSYTANLLQAWAERHGAAPLFILGDEDFASLHTWRDGLTLPHMADFVVVPRSGAGSTFFEETLSRLWPDLVVHPFPRVPGALYAVFPPAEEEQQPCTSVFLPVPRLDISASQVRTLWSAGRDLRYLVPDSVRHLMHVHSTELHRVWNLHS